MTDDLKHVCPHCNAVNTRLIGDCAVCGRIVCERCGNVQHAQGDRRVSHDECVKHDDSAFSMIKFVR